MHCSFSLAEEVSRVDEPLTAAVKLEAAAGFTGIRYHAGMSEVLMRIPTPLFFLAGIFLPACGKDSSGDSGGLNTPPSIDAAEIQPQPVFESSLVDCVGVGWEDPDGDPPYYALEWRVNGEVVSTGAQIDGAVFDKGDAVDCVLTPLDSGGEGESKMASVVVQNSPPQADGTAIEPDPLTVEDTARVRINGEADGDSDAVTWSHVWWVNGEAVSTDPLLSGNLLVRGDRVVAESTPSDGEEEGAAVLSAEVEVANAAPVVLSVSIYPPSPSPSDLLSAIVSTDDSDGDAVEVAYTWSVNGSDSGSTATLSGVFSVNDEVRVHVTPSDELEEGVEVSSDPVVIVPE